MQGMNQEKAALVAADVGNSRIKLGLFDPAAKSTLPVPIQTLELDAHEGDLDSLIGWLDAYALDALKWHVGSVNRSAATRLVAWLRNHGGGDNVTMLAAGDLPLRVELERPDLVGIDRLLASVAANRLRRSDSPAVVVDMGSAITVDLIGTDGAFRGGAIMPGIGMAARALHEFTDLLPLLEMDSLGEAPDALGRSTVAAMQSGLYWGALGGIRELIGRLVLDQPGTAEVFLSGGFAPSVAQLLPFEVQYVPHLVLSGIAATAGF